MKRMTMVLLLGLVCAAIAGCGNTNTPGRRIIRFWSV